jgi:hypothetical protein
VFIAIACHWQANAEAWPSQETIAAFSGYSARAVRTFVDVLDGVGIVRTRRVRQASGAERIYYAPGRLTLTELAAFVERFPRGRPKILGPAQSGPAKPRAAIAQAPAPPEAGSGAPPEGASTEPRDRDPIEPSSCEASPPVARSSTPEEQEQPEGSDEDRKLARIALAERMARKHPTRAPPRWFDAGDVALVAARVGALGGDRRSRLTALRDALGGAFVASKDGPPTVRFIWGTFDHFLDHVERGRRRRLAEERAARACDPGASRAASSRFPKVVDAPVPREQMAADLERLFGCAWRAPIPP